MHRSELLVTRIVRAGRLGREPELLDLADDILDQQVIGDTVAARAENQGLQRCRLLDRKLDPELAEPQLLGAIDAGIEIGAAIEDLARGLPL